MNKKSPRKIERDLMFSIRTHLGQEPSVRAVGLSGGVDSLLLAETLKRLEIPFYALHFNHRWRGTKSDADAAWVAQWCHLNEVPLISGKSRSGGPTSEGKAREARWSFYLRQAQKLSLHELWLGHHADDLVETFLMQLLRGAGPDGLTSLKFASSRASLRILRPLLCHPKSDILALANDWNLTWREDSSNESLEFFRNRVRKQLIPYLTKIAGRDPAPLIARTAAIMADENAWWETLLPDRWPKRASCFELAAQPVAFQRRYLKGWLREQGVTNATFQQIEEIRSLLQGNQPAKINLSSGRHCRRTRNLLYIE